MNAPASKPVPESLQRENACLRGDLLTIALRITHDLRTPLGGIITATEALQEILGDSEPAAASLTESSLSSAEELSRLIKRFSFVAKATAQPRPAQALNMGEPVAVALERLHPQILKQGAVITQPATWPEVQGVTAWLEVVWWNLLVNALEHAGAAPHIELGWRTESGKQEFWVADRGPDVPEAKRSTLFQPFHTLHESNAPRGLGLPIVQRLIELQGGYCGYKPVPNGGACFFFGWR